MRNLLIFIAVIELCGCFAHEPKGTSKLGKAFPSFKILLADSATYLNTQSIAVGKPIVFFYFGPYCVYSRAQIEEIIKNIDTLRDIQFYLFTPSPFSEMKEFYTHYHLEQYSNIRIGIDYTGFFGTYFETQVVPFLAIYSKEKNLNGMLAGYVSSSQIKDIAYK